MPIDNRIRIVQCKCAHGHCIMAVAFEPRDISDEVATDKLAVTVGFLKAAGHLNPWCALCHSRDWHYEVAITRFYSMAQATPHLADLERRQALTRELLAGAPAEN